MNLRDLLKSCPVPDYEELKRRVEARLLQGTRTFLYGEDVGKKEEGRV